MIAHLLNTGDWRSWDNVDVEDWCARAIALLVKKWNQFDSFKDGSASSEAAYLESQRLFLDWDSPDLGVKKGFTALWPSS